MPPAIPPPCYPIEFGTGGIESLEMQERREEIRQHHELWAQARLRQWCGPKGDAHTFPCLLNAWPHLSWPHKMRLLKEDRMEAWKTRTCPECKSGDYQFRSRKVIKPAEGQPPSAETTYRCKSCGHVWREFADVP
jgi:DNA-directed RNA polymerase subunit M/transcription elongation factor TFIIS